MRGLNALRQAVIALSAAQLAVAIFAVYASSQNPISAGACIAGIAGTMFSFVLLAGAGLWIMVLLAMSYSEKAWRIEVKLAGILMGVTALAMLIGSRAALLCTV